MNYYELILTENCNLRCKYCFDDAFSDRTGCSYDYSMKLEMIDDIISFIEKTKDKDRETTVSFFGGEPTMNWEFIEKFVEKSNGRYRFSTNSNLVALNSKRIDFLVKNKIIPIISLDGIKKSHNINRLTVGAFGSWDLTMKNLPELTAKFRSVGINLSALMVVNDNNYQYLEESYEFLIGLGVDVNVLYNFNTQFSDEAYESIEKQLTSLFKIKNLPLYGDLKKRVLNQNFYKQQNFCHTPDSAVTISPNGKLFFCHQLVPKMQDNQGDEYYGDIYKGLYNEEYISVMRDRTNIEKFKLGKECEVCPAVNWCKGGCISAMRINEKTYDKLTPTLCKINKMLDRLFVHPEG